MIEDVARGARVREVMDGREDVARVREAARAAVRAPVRSIMKVGNV